MAGDIVGQYHALSDVVRFRTFAELAALPHLPALWSDQPTTARAIAFLSERSLLTPAKFAALEERARFSAFTFAGATSRTMLRTANDSLKRSLKLGLNADEAGFALNRRLIAAGYTALDPRHARLVARQTFATAYGAATYDTLTDPQLRGLVPMLRYVTMDDDRVRPAHAALHNKVFLASSSIWLSIWPPNGYNCRCVVRGVSAATVERLDLTPDKVPHWTTDAKGRRIKVGPDEGFAGTPAKQITNAVRTGRRT